MKETKEDIPHPTPKRSLSFQLVTRTETAGERVEIKNQECIDGFRGNQKRKILS